MTFFQDLGQAFLVNCCITIRSITDCLCSKYTNVVLLSTFYLFSPF